jgi:uncharacterized spore protein YtfJ
MALNRLFDQIEKARETAHWRAAFGEPQIAGDHTLIPVARVGYTFGLGFGQGTGPTGEEGPAPEGEGGGAGGGASVRPLGTIVVTPDEVYFEESVDATRIALAAIGLAGLVTLQLLATLRAIFGRS